MITTFPFPIMLQGLILEETKTRLEPLTNINGGDVESPSLRGQWKIHLNVVASGEDAHLALSAFISSAKRAGVQVEVPVCQPYRPYNSAGRMLHGCRVAGESLWHHVGFTSNPYDGYRFALDAYKRNEWVTISHPVLSQGLRGGHIFTLGNRLHRVIQVHKNYDVATAKGYEAQDIHFWPPLRENYSAGEIVIVDQPKLLCVLSSADNIGLTVDRFQKSALVFLEHL